MPQQFLQGTTPPGIYNYLGVVPTDVFANAINMFPNQYPLTSRLNKLHTGSPSFNVTNDNFRPKSILLNNAAATGTGTTFIVADASAFDLHDVIQVELEYMLVTGVNLGTNTLTVTRGYAGTTAATHADVLPVYLVTNTRTGAEVNIPALSRKPTLTTQWVQTIQHAYSVGGQTLDTTNYVSAYGGPLQGERYRCASEVFRDFERALVYGKVVPNTGDTTMAMMGGLQQLIVTNYTSNPTNKAAYKASDLIRDTTQACFNGSGQPTHLIVSTDFMAAFATWGTPAMRLNAGASTFGVSIDMFAVSFLPTLNIIADPMLKAGTVICLSIQECMLRMQRDMTEIHRGLRGDAVEGDMLMRGAIQLNNEAHHAFVEGITAFA